MRFRLLAMVAWAAAACVSLAAQAPKTITIRMLDSRTGRLIATTDFLVRIDRQEQVHADWVRQNENGAGVMTVPPDAKLISIRGKYDNAMSVFVNCDTVQDRPSSDRAAGLDHWYAVSEILATGVVAYNGCINPKQTAKLNITAKPGEFVFFVRKRNWREEAVD